MKLLHIPLCFGYRSSVNLIFSIVLLSTPIFLIYFSLCPGDQQLNPKRLLFNQSIIKRLEQSLCSHNK